MLDHADEGRGLAKGVQIVRAYLFDSKPLLLTILVLAVLWPLICLYSEGGMLGASVSESGSSSAWRPVGEVLTLVGMGFSAVVALGVTQPVLKHRVEGFLLPFVLYVALWTEMAVVVTFLAFAYL